MVKAETERVDFLVPTGLLKAFDQVIVELHFPNRTDAFLALMRALLKYHSVDKAAKEA